MIIRSKNSGLCQFVGESLESTFVPGDTVCLNPAKQSTVV